jgi:glycosyltransferase involved in cell wall biosynthesis
LVGQELLLVSLGPVHADGEDVTLDRKFHTGMVEFARRLSVPLSCLVPLAPLAHVNTGIDPVSLRRGEMPYQVHAVPADRRLATKMIDEAVERSALVYLAQNEWLNREAGRACRRRGIPYAVVLECTLRTELDIIRVSAPDPLRLAYRSLRTLADQLRTRQLVSKAAEAHANGYPTFRTLARLAPSRLLYLDTRANASDVISEEAVGARLASRGSRPLRIIHSGRFEPIKGVLDVVRVGLSLAKVRPDVCFDLYGNGSLTEEMRAMVRSAGAGDRVVIHDPVPYPELVRLTREADVFVSCHAQGDPSCTYLETLACGVPIVGYANEMWTELCRESQAGVVVDPPHPAGAVRELEQLLDDGPALVERSLAARRFAVRHTMEVAWDARASRLAALLGQGAALPQESAGWQAARS